MGREGEVGGEMGNELGPNRENRTLDDNRVDKSCNHHHNSYHGLLTRAGGGQVLQARSQRIFRKSLGSQRYCFSILWMRRLLAPEQESGVLSHQPTQPGSGVLPQQPGSHGHSPRVQDG